SRYLGRIRSKHSYTRLKKDVKNFFGRIPIVGNGIVLLLHRLKKSLKFLLVPGEFFEDLGLYYIGPVDGHNISAVQDALRKADETKGPVVVHVITKKGKGYKPAEEKPALFHGVSPFNKETGEPCECGEASFSSGFADKITELAENDEKISAVTAAMPIGTGLEKFAAKFPERFCDVGIAEQHAVTMAAGMSICGAKPVIAVYSTFLQRGYDQLLHDVALQKLPLVIALDRAGINGQDGETHQGIYDFAYLGHLPNMNIAAPCSIKEMQEMLEIAMQVYDSYDGEKGAKESAADDACKNNENAGAVIEKVPHGCFVIRYPAKERLKEHSGLKEYVPVEFGRGCVMFDSANGEKADLCIMAVGAIAEEAIKAAEMLLSKGVSVRVFNPRFVKPLDEKGIIEQASNADAVITVEEAVRFGGFGEQAELVMLKNGIKTPVKIIALPDENIPHGKISQIQSEFGLDAAGIVSAYGDFADET
ncbi:MAG: 1-deoxy-D-xylulose-5-phosphate synthase, partial [Clostridia bacterium]|nr:1-deoxy-D-xylulose-5-phosphate synthase [Clostridia bacterium]